MPGPLPLLARLAASLGIPIGKYIVNIAKKGWEYKSGGAKALAKEVSKKKTKSSKGRQRQRVLNPDEKKQLMKKAARAENKATKAKPKVDADLSIKKSSPSKTVKWRATHGSGKNQILKTFKTRDEAIEWVNSKRQAHPSFGGGKGRLPRDSIDKINE